MRLLREPFFHFLLLGVALFALYQAKGAGDGAPEGDRRITVSAGRIEQRSRIFAKTWQRPPTEAELKGLIDDFVLEEAYYRHAKAMGVDQDDTMIRRRLRQKVEFLTDDAATLVQPSDEELATYLAENPDKFRADPEYTFRQVYINPEKHGPDPEAYARTLADEARGGAEVEGDQTLLAGAFEKASKREVDGTFGLGFSAKLDALPVGEWSDPIRSGIGLHLIKIDGRVPGEIPDLDGAKSAVRREWENDRRTAMRDAFNARLLEDYEIEVEWPKASEGG